MAKSIVMDGITAGEEADLSPGKVSLALDGTGGRAVVRFNNEAGYVSHELDLVETMAWLERQVPGSIDFARLDAFLKLELGYEADRESRGTPEDTRLLERTRIAPTNDGLVREPVAYTMEGVWTGDDPARLALFDGELSVVIPADGREAGLPLEAVLGWINGRFPGVADMGKISPALDDARQALETAPIPVSA
jgi:hypothetical protein